MKLPYTDPKATHVFHLFPVIVEDRDGFQEYLKDRGIGTQVHYPIPPYVAECYADQGYDWEDYPNAAYIARHEVSLPMYSGMDPADADVVIKAVNEY